MSSPTDYPLSWKPDSTFLKRPIYLSLSEQLENDIRTGLLRPGMRLPAQRELANFLGINFTTVTRCYKLCEMKGLVYAITGSGTFVSPHAARSITISADSQGRCIDLAFVASFEQCNTMIQETVRSVAQKKYFSQLLDYKYPLGMPHHKSSGIAWLKKLGIDVDMEHIAIVSGASNALKLSLLAFFKEGDRIAVDAYTFPNFVELAKLHGLHLVPIPSDEEGMLPDILEARCRQKSIRGIFLMPSCCNPTTCIISENRKKLLAKIIQKYNLLLLEDDTHGFLTAGIVSKYQGPLSCLIPEQSIYIYPTSKSLSSGLRIAYVAFGENLKSPLLKSIYNANVKTSSLNAEIVTELLKNGRADEIIKTKKTLIKQANVLYEQYFTPTLCWQHPFSFFRWLPLNGIYHGEDFEEHLRFNGVSIFHSFRFASGVIDKKQYIRIALSTVETMDALKLGFDILKTELVKLGALSSCEK